MPFQRTHTGAKCRACYLFGSDNEYHCERPQDNSGVSLAVFFVESLLVIVKQTSRASKTDILASSQTPSRICVRSSNFFDSYSNIPYQDRSGSQTLGL